MKNYRIKQFPNKITGKVSKEMVFQNVTGKTQFFKTLKETTFFPLMNQFLYQLQEKLKKKLFKEKSNKNYEKLKSLKISRKKSFFLNITEKVRN